MSFFPIIWGKDGGLGQKSLRDISNLNLGWFCDCAEPRFPSPYFIFFHCDAKVRIKNEGWGEHEGKKIYKHRKWTEFVFAMTASCYVFGNTSPVQYAAVQDCDLFLDSPRTWSCGTLNEGEPGKRYSGVLPSWSTGAKRWWLQLW